MKIRLFAGAAAVTASLFLSQASIGVAAEPLVLTPAQMDAVAAGLSVKVDVKAKAAGDKAAASSSARVAVAGKKGHGVRIEVTTSDKGKDGKAPAKAEKKPKVEKVKARQKLKATKATAQHKLKAAKATVEHKLKAVRVRIEHVKHH